MREPAKMRKQRAVRAQGRRVTLAEVAARSGVSTITVSRALREPARVSADTLARVRRAIAQLGYVENRVASGLASGSSRIVPVLIPTLTHAVYVPFLRGVHAELDEHGYQVLLATTEYERETEAQLVETLLGWFPAGLLLAGVDHTPAARQRLVQAVAQGIAVVEFMDLAPTPIDLNVGLSHAAVGAAVAEHLVAKGLEHVAYAGTLAARDTRSARRAQGFREALEARGLPHYELRLERPFSIGLGGTLTDTLLDRHPRLQAIFFANDDLAAGGLFAAQRRRLRIPDELALVGFNDLEIASVVHPSLTSVAVDQEAMGRTAARLLLARLRGEDVPAEPVDVGFRIVERDSTRGLPRQGLS